VVALDLSRHRYRRALLTAGSSVAARAVAIAASLISVPLTLHYLGTTRYGVWMTLSSFGNLLAFADVGVSNGLINAVARASARDDELEVRRYVSSAMVALSAIGACIVVPFLVIGPYLSWAAIFSSGGALAADEIWRAVELFVVCFAVSLPATAIYRVQAALQQGYTAGLWQLAGSLASLVALLVVISLKGGLAALVLSSFGINAAVGALSALWSWTHSLRWTRPGMRYVGLSHLRSLFGTGGYFFVLQITGSLAYSADNIIITQTLGPAAVAGYSVVARIFESIVGIASMFAAPMWPAFADAAAREDHEWAARALKKTLWYTLLGLTMVVVAVVTMSEPLLRAWLGRSVPYSLALFAAYGLWAVTKGVGAPCAAFLNGTGILAQQVWIAGAFAVTSVLARIYAVKALGVAGVPLALTVTYLLCVLVPYALIIPAYLNSKSPTTTPTSNQRVVDA
jgi:O-antigen/teichoic acid export membrane protein